MNKGGKFGAGPPPYLKERYRLVEWVGEGSMGVVYRAHDETLDRPVAIKFLPPGHVGSEAGERFLREARAVARLTHPNIMTLHDVDREGGWFYLVLEYIPGHDLHTVLQKKAPLPLNEALPIVRGTLAALGYAHSQGIIHRDLKPENIMLTPDGRIKVTDFGLARVQNEVRVTPAGALLGTVLYLAPELIVGQTATAVSDLYAIGGILHELLTGQPPFPGDQPTAVLIQTLNDPVTPPRQLNPAIPAAIEKIILQLLDKEPANRYQSAGEVLAALPRQSEPADSPLPESPAATASLVARIVRASSTAVPTPDSPAEAPDSLPNLLMAAALEDTAVALEAERRRLARLLQESIVEPLTLLLSQAGIYEQTMGGNPPARMAVSVLTTLARQVLQQARDLESNLYPALLESLGLEPALEALANQEMRAHGLQITLNLRRLPERLPPAIELVLFRVTQAALDQAVKQAHATEIAIHLEQQDGGLIYRLEHNGRSLTVNDFLAVSQSRIAGLGGVLESDGRKLTIRFGLVTAVDLTPREMDVIQLLAEGLSNKEMAQILSVSPRTINFHLDNIYSKLGVGSRTEAAVYALRQGWVRSD